MRDNLDGHKFCILIPLQLLLASLRFLSVLLMEGKSIDEIIEIIKVEDTPIYGFSEDALKIFKLNTELYPDKGNTYDSYSKCLLKLGDVENVLSAIE